MRITVTERLRPFSHTPGIECVLPGSSYSVQIYPCFLRFYELSTTPPTLKFELALHFKGPLARFTVSEDLERGEIKVWGDTAEGFMRYRLVNEAKFPGINLIIEKAPREGVHVAVKEGTFVWYREKGVDSVREALMNATEMLALGKEDINIYSAPVTDRLSLGSHKAQDWDLVKRRLDLTEIFPVWYRLGQLIPSVPIIKEGTGHLLLKCQELIANRKSEAIYSAFLELFQAGFQGILVPRLVDNQYQGIISTDREPPSESPLFLLSEGARLIRNLFIEEKGNEIDLLPASPPQFHCGRFIQVPLKGGVIDLEWSKKTVRRLVFYATEDQEIIFNVKHLKSFRLREAKNDKGQRLMVGNPIKLEKNCYYFFDNFMR